MVLQDQRLFHGTIRRTSRTAATTRPSTRSRRPHAPRAWTTSIPTLPEGYHTIVDDDSTNLSQGEKQLLTIARAFLVDPQILILDEATSSVDTRTEVLIKDAMTELMRGGRASAWSRTASRRSRAPTILVMDRRRIVEHGNHELLGGAASATALYHSQFLEPLEEAS